MMGLTLRMWMWSLFKLTREIGQAQTDSPYHIGDARGEPPDILFNDPAMCDQAKKDPDLAVLARRDEFRQIIDPPEVKF
jgi:hypothetical protein